VHQTGEVLLAVLATEDTMKTNRQLAHDVTAKEFNEVIKQVEARTCFRMTAAVDDHSAMMVPVDADGNVVGDCTRFKWRQLKVLATLPKKFGKGE
jgi:hypothetical protein